MIRGSIVIKMLPHLRGIKITSTWEYLAHSSKGGVLPKTNEDYSVRHYRCCTQTPGLKHAEDAAIPLHRKLKIMALRAWMPGPFSISPEASVYLYISPLVGT